MPTKTTGKHIKVGRYYLKVEKNRVTVSRYPNLVGIYTFSKKDVLSIKPFLEAAAMHHQGVVGDCSLAFIFETDGSSKYASDIFPRNGQFYVGCTPIDLKLVNRILKLMDK
jgi:hypothetical protein